MRGRPELGAECIPGVGREHCLHYMGDDLPRPQGAGAEQEGVAESLCPLADDAVHLVALVTDRPVGDETERDRRAPMLVDALGEGARIGAAVMGGEIVGKAAILQVALIASEADPVTRGAEQRAALRGEGRAFLWIRYL